MEPMEEDLKIIKVENLSNHWSDLPQILNLSLGDQIKVQRLKYPSYTEESAIATQTGEVSRFGKITRICQEIANKAEPETRAARV